MDLTDHPAAPPVVTVTVVHDPGPWFDEALDGLARQDYPNVRHLFLLTGDAVDDIDGLQARIARRVDDPIVRQVGANPGFGPAANAALHLVEGAGFFCFLHDDVVLRPTALSELVTELYRSNAGIVGPKLVDWHRPDVLQEVGLSVDRLGVVLPIVEPGELDQEQHDAVRDVFCVPSACLLVRIDLFRSLGGFADDIDFVGDDLDLCWRAHLSGARVLVVPAAEARHLGGLAERRPDLDLVHRSETHRMRTALSAPSGLNLLWLLPLHVVSTIGGAAVGAVSGHTREGGASIRALVTESLAVPRLVSRRRRVQGVREVSDGEVAALQLGGSARLRAYQRARAARHEAREAAETAQRVPSAGATDVGTIVAWLLVSIFLLVGSRSLISSGVPLGGDLLAWPGGSGLDPWRDYASGWWSEGLGSARAAPLGAAALGALGVASFASTGLARLLLVVAPLFLGALGCWVLAKRIGGTRSAQVAIVVYAATPLMANSVAVGSLPAVLAFGALPWVWVLVARLGRWGGPGAVATRRRDAADILTLGLLMAAVSALAPPFALLAVLVVLLAALGSAVAGRLARTGWVLGGTVAAFAIAMLLHLPAAARLQPFGRPWWVFAGLEPADPQQRGLLALVTFDIGPHGLSFLALGLALPLVVAVVLARDERFAWAARAAVVALGCLLLAWLVDRGTIDARPAMVPFLLAPVALAFAMGAAATIAAFLEDLPGRQLSWRQLLGPVAVVAVVIGLVPALPAAADGAWKLDDEDLPVLLTLLADDPELGPGRVLWVGPPEDLPVPSWPLADGTGHAMTDREAPTLYALWPDQTVESEQQLASGLDLAATSATDRLGRLIGPMGIQYVLVPGDGSSTDEADPVAPPTDPLAGMFARQLDIAEVELGDDRLLAFRNASALPVRGELGGSAAEASRQGGFDTIVPFDLTSTRAAVLPGDRPTSGEGPVGPEAVSIAESANPGWTLSVDGVEVPARVAFGWANGFDVTGAGRGEVRYETPTSWRVMVVVQALLWVAALVAVIVLRAPARPRRRDRVEDEGPAISLGEHDLTDSWAGAG